MLGREKKFYNNVLCVYPHQEGVPEKKYCPPIGLEYIATVLESLVEKVTLIDMRFEPNLNDFLKEADLVCLSVNWDYQREAAINIIAQISSDIKVIVGGRDATVHVEELFAAAPNIDIIVRGDGEEIIRDIVSGLSLGEITGISYREDGKIIHNKVRDLHSLNDAIYPNRKMRRANYRLLYGDIDLGLGMDFISTSRGCPYNCKFCTFTNNPLGQKRDWSARSARSVIEELKTIDAGFVFIVDDNFAIDMKRVEEICNLIIAEGIKKTFMVALRLEIYKHPQVLKKMFKAGFKILTIGIESAQNKTLKAMQKGFDTTLAKKAFAKIRKTNFYIHGYFIIGCIGESESEMLEIAYFARELKLDTISLSLLRTEKYSPLNDLISSSTGYYVGENNIVCSMEYPLEKLGDIRRRIGRSYYNFPTVLRITKKIFTARLITFPHLAKLIFILFLRGVLNNKKRRNYGI
ncbi:radical SAM protein [candidate division NPL-UPA2 bacterium Unc8]|uniref:Radical SAM protein n=1 Tax=candidate division NPL-UPA2 bacterium Unc8 TaxID=1980939 RepID=A0A399FZQ2_UNCN2|nr:Hopanoid C-3 methylase [Bacillota bacterium]RII00742.1 MAG: radical SAM protein [candidate division NPL-UPA2 bacterium Unc8]